MSWYRSIEGHGPHMMSSFCRSIYIRKELHTDGILNSDFMRLSSWNADSSGYSKWVFESKEGAEKSSEGNFWNIIPGCHSRNRFILMPCSQTELVSCINNGGGITYLRSSQVPKTRHDSEDSGEYLFT